MKKEIFKKIKWWMFLVLGLLVGFFQAEVGGAIASVGIVWGCVILIKHRRLTKSLKSDDSVDHVPGTVYVSPSSKVYHSGTYGCCGFESVDAVEMTEKKAIAQGLTRCKKCDWYEFDREVSHGKK